MFNSVQIGYEIYIFFQLKRTIFFGRSFLATDQSEKGTTGITIVKNSVQKNYSAPPWTPKESPFLYG